MTVPISINKYQHCARKISADSIGIVFTQDLGWGAE